MVKDREAWHAAVHRKESDKTETQLGGKAICVWSELGLAGERAGAAHCTQPSAGTLACGCSLHAGRLNRPPASLLPTSLSPRPQPPFLILSPGWWRGVLCSGSLLILPQTRNKP